MKSRANRDRPPRGARAPRATYRLQLRAGMDLWRASRLVPYLAQLGVSHLYLSPIFAARSGSSHGYDVVDPTCVDPELGGEAALGQLVRALRRHGLALLLDIVPNHMAAHPENPYFEDVLAHGRKSAFAGWFDIDWGVGPDAERLVLPVLASSLSSCMARGEIRVETSSRVPRLRYFNWSLPLAPGTSGPNDRAFDQSPSGHRRLRRVLADQHYRLTWWRRAGSELNYRRFFDINELIALRADEPAVFEATHAQLLEWVERGWVQGVRVDHVDGLADPTSYLRRLRRGLRRAAGSRDILLVVEKILARDEGLPSAWPVDGTTGYEFLNAVEAGLLEPAGTARIERGWRGLTGVRSDFARVARASKRRVLTDGLRPDVRRLMREFRATGAPVSGIPTAELRAAVIELLVHLDVYRTYPRPRGLGRAERRHLARAFEAATASGHASRPALKALRRVLLPGPRGYGTGPLAAARRFGQVAAPAMAKGVEDTAFYVYTPLLSRNEVGGEPGAPLHAAAAELHARNRTATRHAGLLAVSTHDTKRSADVRARLDVLSEFPEEWLAAVRRWLHQNQALHGKTAADARLDPATEWLFYQSLVGVWPLSREPALPERPRLRELANRLEAYLLKAAREAKRRTSWRNPHPGFEASLCHFVRAALDPTRKSARDFLNEVARFAHRVGRPGLWNSLARTLVTLGSPGLPDLYQGDEVWNFSLVDPDNRRPVDFAALERRLRSVETELRGSVGDRCRWAARRCSRPEDPWLKLWVIRVGLAARRRNPALFLHGRYQPLRAEGSQAEHILAFARRRRECIALVAVARWTGRLAPLSDAPPLGSRVWGDTQLVLPTSFAGRRFQCAFTGRRRTLPAGNRPVWPVAELLAPLPVALLLS